MYMILTNMLWQYYTCSNHDVIFSESITRLPTDVHARTPLKLRPATNGLGVPWLAWTPRGPNSAEQQRLGRFLTTRKDLWVPEGWVTSGPSIGHIIIIMIIIIMMIIMIMIIMTIIIIMMMMMIIIKGRVTSGALLGKLAPLRRSACVSIVLKYPRPGCCIDQHVA